MKPAVVIPVHRDPQGLQATLAALPEVLVVVVVDGQHAPTEAVARAAGAQTVVLPASRGSYAARNAGLQALPADIEAVLFTDAGCIPQPGWVQAHLDALALVELSAGGVLVTHAKPPTPAEWVDRCRNLRQEAYVRDDGFGATCNLAVRRSVLSSVAFDARLRSGGDRDFCLRAVATGATLRYTADALIHHPARRTRREVLAKARRVGQGLADMPPRTRPVPPRVRRPHRGLARLARQAGVKVSPWWTIRVALLDYERARVLSTTALRNAKIEGLHVVVLMASRWATLEEMNTRWRRIVESWSSHPAIEQLTVVDHPWFRRTVRPPLTTQATSWMTGIDLRELVVPTTVEPSWSDALAWRMAARSLRRSWPAADRRLVVATSPLVAPLLPHVAEAGTITAFDEVDLWYRSHAPGPLGHRIADGFRFVAAADTATSVSPRIAKEFEAQYGLSAVVVRNGVDLTAYGSADADLLPMPLPSRPFALYVGSLSSRLDLQLVTDVADLLIDEMAIVLAGPADPETADVIRGSSVHWLGPVSSTLVPHLLAAAAVALFPHRATDHTEAIDSMKMIEYLASGVPIVSTELPGIPEGVEVANGAAQFAASVRRAAAQPRRADRHPAVRSWDEVADEMLTAMLGGGS